MGEPVRQPPREDIDRFRSNYLNELDGAALYRALAAAETNESRAQVLTKLALAEERHASRWAGFLRTAGETVPVHKPSARVRALGWLARRLGVQKILPLVTTLEARDEGRYRGQAGADGLPAEERAHRLALEAMVSSGKGGVEAVRARERWHRRGQSGTLRAAVFGVNDGLVSNVSLIMGVAGADVGAHGILVTGIAGMLAGAFSMATGEYVSMKAQREMAERQIALEKEELAMAPEEEQEELSLIYQAKGMREEDAALLASRIIKEPETALDTLAREELGLDPSELGSPWGAAASSFLAFAVGAVIPLAPFTVRAGSLALPASAVVSAIGLFVIGAALSLFTGRNPLVSGVRMLALGLLAACATFGVGRLLGVSVAG